MFNYLSKLLYILSGQKNYLALLIVLCLVTSLLETFGIGLVGPFIALASSPGLIHHYSWSEWIYQRLHLDSDIQMIGLLGLSVSAILCLKSILSFNIQKSIFEFGFGLQAELRLKLMQTYLTVPYVFHLNHNTAFLIQNVVNETEIFANKVLMPTLTAASNFTIILALVTLLLLTNPMVITSVVIMLLIAFWLLYRFKDKIFRWGKEGSEANSEIIRIVNHGLGGLKDIRIIGCESYFLAQLRHQADRFKYSSAYYNAFALVPRYTLEPFLIIMLVGFSIFYLLFNRDPKTLTSMLSVFAIASIRLLPAMSSFMQGLSVIRHSTYTVRKLYTDLKEVETAIGSKTLNSLSLAAKKNEQDLSILFKSQVALTNITFRYPGVSIPTIKNVSLVIKKGESIGLIGKSGAGKTTLVDLILGLLEPSSGYIQVDKQMIDYKNICTWQHLVGYISQSIFLIDDSIEKNIAFGVEDSQIDSLRLQKAIELSQLKDFIDALPNGVKTSVGERGVCLSGGQRQRIGIARALYHEREVLVLDEATSALDNETERLVSQSIRSLSRTKTSIIIAHRLSTLEQCDRIYVLDQGQIIKSGSYQEVVLD
jgi:ABC-type multidrug transport system fused ATPase/permease subunit